MLELLKNSEFELERVDSIWDDCFVDCANDTPIILGLW